MVAGRHNLTRRQALGAGAGACLAAAAPAAAAPAAAAPAAVARGPVSVHIPALRARWDRALAGFRRAEARLAAWRAYVESLPPERRAFPACEPLDERFDDLECARLAALRRLLRLPAPDPAALALKIALAVDDQAWELAGAETFLATLKADARGLLHGG